MCKDINQRKSTILHSRPLTASAQRYLQPSHRLVLKSWPNMWVAIAAKLFCRKHVMHLLWSLWLMLICPLHSINISSQQCWMNFQPFVHSCASVLAITERGSFMYGAFVSYLVKWFACVVTSCRFHTSAMWGFSPLCSRLAFQLACRPIVSLKNISGSKWQVKWALLH